MKKISKMAKVVALVVAGAVMLASCSNSAGGGKSGGTTTLGIPTASTADSDGFVTISAGKMKLQADSSYEVTITRAFKICDHEVTQAEWKSVFTGTNDNPSHFDGTSGKEAATDEIQDNRPVENVNWYMAIAYCNKLSISKKLEPCYSVKGTDGDEIDWETLAFSSIPTTGDTNWNAAICDFTKIGYRLPTEAEWEIAARGGVTGDVYAGTAEETQLGNYAWYFTNSENKTHEVKKKSPNAYGLYDMSGNVWEWCWDWWQSTLSGNATDPVGAVSGSIRVFRGGSWGSFATRCRASYRNYDYWPFDRNRNVGFRVARSWQ